jgi:TRAP-type C4-dicarboxylate transport system substrate-binding protein
MVLSRRFLLAATAGCTAAGLGPAAAQARWQMATPYPDGNFHTRNNRQFIEAVQQATGGKVQVQLHSNAALLKMPEIKRGVQTGQVQIGEILISAYGNEDPFFEVDGIPQLVTTYEEAKRLAELSRPHIEARLNRQGITLLYMVPWPPSGFYTNAPLDSLEGLRGTRFRTYNVQTNRFAALIGATATLVQQAEIPQAFATGVVNAMVTSAQTGVDTQAWDFVKYFTPIGFTFTKNAVFASRRALDAQPADQRDAIRRAAAEAEARGWEASAEARREQERILGERGMTVQQPSAELLAGMARVGAQMTEEWVVKAGEEGRRLIDAYRARA